MPKTAIQIDLAEDMPGDARQYLLSEPVRIGTREWSHVVVTAVDVPDTRDPDVVTAQTIVYGRLADWTTNWLILPGSFVGDQDHAKALEGLGYALESMPATTEGMVRQFHQTFNHPVAGKPGHPDWDTAILRYDMLVEELEEYRKALFEGDLVGIADAQQDMKYLLAGDELVYGFPGPELFRLVHAANMDKRQPDGTVLYWPNGKVRKREGWTGPEAAIAELLRQRGADLPEVAA
ncbi:hypothetical protein ACFTSD_02625 [Nocardiaceae bacterium NPDC056970]